MIGFIVVLLAFGSVISQNDGVQIKTEGDDVLESRSKTVILTCPTFFEEIEWYRNQSERLSDNVTRVFENVVYVKYNVSENSSLHIFKPDYNDTGVYECKGKGTTSWSTAILYARPHIEKFKSMNHKEGETAEIQCKVDSYPKNATVRWSKQDDNNIKDIDGDHRINITDYGEIINGTLTIRDLLHTDRADYICFAYNDFGNDTEKVLVRVKARLAPLYPFLGICAEVVVLCIIILIYERRRAKKKEETDEKDGASPVTNSHSIKGGEEVRHRGK